ncbi:autotransporter outer membrane beta-barrel domain-containing protein [Bosea sp. 2YAB26]|uniref:autotransporter family protein n=1 Tax=Bosea sp. 2YAB26 TaxID=3237478 RepID=UPI003F93D00A
MRMMYRWVVPTSGLPACGAASVGLLLSSLPLGAQTVGPSPPTITATINVTAGTTTVVGSTNVATPGATNASNVTGGTLVIDSLAVPLPGPITFQALNGNALQANGGAITVPNGNLSILTQGGHAVLANGAASSATLNGVSITTTGVGAGLVAIGGRIDATNVIVNNTATATPTISAGHGAIAEGGGTVNLHSGTSITTAAFNSVGLGASGTGSRVIADVLIPVTMNGGGSMGIYLHDGGQVSILPRSTFQMNGTGNVGIGVDNTAVALGTIGNGLTVNLNNASGGPGSTGLFAVNGGSLNIADVTVQGPNAAAGAWARANSSITLSGRSVITINSEQGPNAYVLQTANLATAAGPVGSVFSLVGAIPVSGLLAQGAGALITSTGTTITVTSSNAAAGADAGLGGTVDMTDNTITTTGTNAFGIRVDSNGTVIGRASRVTTSGAGGAALFINGGPGLIDLTGTTVQATGSGTVGLSSLNITPTSVNLVRLSGGSLTSATSTAVEAQGPLNLTTAGTVVTGGGGLLLQTFASTFGPAQPTAVQFDASNGSVLTGDALVAAQTTANISLATGSQWTGAAFDVTNVTVDPTSTWTVTANSTVTQQVANAGLIQFTPPGGDPTILGSYKTLTTRNYLGAGGTLGLNTFLGSDGSPSDRLVINGGVASGNSFLRVTNTTGPGNLTIGNGILVVDAINGGTTVPGAFALGQPVVAGPYEYSLYRSSVDASGPENWYLRSEITPAPPGPGPTPSPPGTGIPDFRRETSLYAALPAMQLIYGRTLIDSLHERVGELAPLEAPAVSEERTIWCKNPDKNFRCTTTVRLPASAAAPGRSYASAGWARIIGTHGNQDGGPWGIFRNGPNYDYDLYAFQAGLDLYRSVSADGSRDHAGIYAAIGRIESDVTHFNGIRAGRNTIDAYSLGGYWTHFGPSGWYLDGVVQGTWYDAKADSKRGFILNRDAFGFAASLEGGYPLQLGYGVILEPQAQLVYQTISNGSASDSAALVRFSDADSLAGRIGARLARSWTLEDATGGVKPRMLTAWLKASLWNEFMGNPKTAFSSATGFIPFRADLGGSWAEFKVGADAQMTRNTALYASAGYSIGLNGRSHAYDGRLGIKVSW